MTTPATLPVKLIECPRDAWQGLPRTIPVAVKADYLRSLIAAGFRHIDAVSFVSPKAVPQMADSESVLAALDAPPDVELIAIVVNQRGAERALATGAVTTLGFPFSISPEFLHRNQNQTPRQALDTLKSICRSAEQSNLNVVAYLSMAFGNPYGEPCAPALVTSACNLLAQCGVHQISLADTVGLATPQQVNEVLSASLVILPPDVELGIHLHASPQDAAAKIAAAYRVGCRRFDTALTGLGGCPFAQDALVGNIATETALAELTRLGATLPDLAPLEGLLAASRDLATHYSELPS
jgi:hydroxymethylglutaryl-CoA lyase